MSSGTAISRIDVRYLFLALLIVSAIPIMSPMGLPMVVSPLTKKSFNFIEGLPAGSVVILDAQHSTGYGPELGTQYAAVFKHLLARPLKVVLVAFGAEGPQLYAMTLEGSTISGPPIDPNRYGKKYGTDYVWLGYIPGTVTAFAAFASNSWLTKTDAAGTALEQLPIMQNCKTVKDWALVVSVSGGQFEQMIAQWYSAYKTPIIFGAPGVSAPRLYSYIDAGQLTGMLVSIGGAAEYELLLKGPALAVSLMDVLNLAQILVVVAMIAGNAIHFIGRSKEKK